MAIQQTFQDFYSNVPEVPFLTLEWVALPKRLFVVPAFFWILCISPNKPGYISLMANFWCLRCTLPPPHQKGITRINLLRNHVEPFVCGSELQVEVSEWGRGEKSCPRTSMVKQSLDPIIRNSARGGRVVYLNASLRKKFCLQKNEASSRLM